MPAISPTAGRWGTPEDLKGAILFLSSDASNYVHDIILTVDGGWMGRQGIHQ
jgi:2-deoxy-D-gluconate 3-dehydrogenase